MRTHFAEVLTRERARLAEVRDGATLEAWRQDLVAEMMTPESPYLAALRRTDEEASDRADFLNQWRDLIAQMIEGMPQFRGSDEVEPRPGVLQRRASTARRLPSSSSPRCMGVSSSRSLRRMPSLSMLHSISPSGRSRLPRVTVSYGQDRIVL